MKTIIKFPHIVFLLICITLLQSCNLSHKKEIISQCKSTNTNIIKIPDFDEIYVNGAAEVIYVTGGGAPLVIVTASDSISNNIIVHVEERKLFLEVKDDISYDTLRFEIHGTSMLENIELNGATFMRICGTMNPRNIDIDCNGASTIEIDEIHCTELNIDCFGASFANISNIICDEIDVDCNGASTAKLEGRCHNARYEANGASTINSALLNAINIEKSIENGASTIIIQ